MKNYQNIPATVLVTGANILGLEIIASRLMAPTFGNSIFIWGGILSVTMLCLALGYAWGGSLADKPDVPSRKLVLHILLSAAWISLVPVFNGFIMKGGLGLGHYLGPILVSLVILGPPLTLLSTAVPLGFGIRLQTRQSKPGKSVGRLFAISTAGSIVGALITAYFLVPFLGVRSSFFFLTGSLILTLSPSLCRNQFLKSATLILFLLVLVRQLPPAYRGVPVYPYGVGELHREESRYGHLAVLEDRREQSRILLLDGTSQNWVTGPEWSESRLNYIDMTMRQAASIRNRKDKRALVLGLGAGTVVRKLQSRGFQVDVAELDSAMLHIAEDWFHFRNNPARVFLHDGRTVMRKMQREGMLYDLILLDAAGGGDQPLHLYNRDAFEQAKSLLKPGGIFTANVIAITNPQNPLAGHLAAGLKMAFLEVDVINLHPHNEEGRIGNYFLIGSDRMRLRSQPRNFAPYEQVEMDLSLRPLTDDWNPAYRWSVKSNIAFHRHTRKWLGDASVIPY